MTSKLSPDELDLQDHQAKIKKAANWFYWIAALSVINSLIMAFNGSISFVVGLGTTLIIDGMAIGMIQEGAPEFLKYIALGLSTLVAGCFALCGLAGTKRMLPIYIIGMAFYALDALLFVLFQDWLPVAFHAFALFNLWKAVGATKEYKALETSMQLKEPSFVEAQV